MKGRWVGCVIHKHMSVRPKPVAHATWLREALEHQAAHVRAIEASGELAALNARVAEAAPRPEGGPATVAGREVGRVLAALQDTSDAVVPAERDEAKRAAGEILAHVDALRAALGE